MIMEHCKVTKMEAIKALREADGDKVNAILKLSDKWDFWINLFFILNEFKSLKLKKNVYNIFNLHDCHFMVNIVLL